VLAAMASASRHPSEPARPVRAGTRSRSDSRGKFRATQPSGVGSRRQEPLGEVRPCRPNPSSTARPATAAGHDTRTRLPTRAETRSISPLRKVRRVASGAGGICGGPAAQPVRAMSPERARVTTSVDLSGPDGGPSVTPIKTILPYPYRFELPEAKLAAKARNLAGWANTCIRTARPIGATSCSRWA
jgi:hypothetical protein